MKSGFTVYTVRIVIEKLRMFYLIVLLLLVGVLYTYFRRNSPILQISTKGKAFDLTISISNAALNLKKRLGLRDNSKVVIYIDNVKWFLFQ